MEILVGYLQSGLSAIIPFIILLGLLIFVHELGHFLVAKYYGVRVEVFSLGFGKKILQFKRGFTTYAISMIPLGGYVKMFGDDPTQELPEQEKEVAFLHKPVGQRIAIVLAGPLMNFFFAILLFFAVAMIGEEQALPVVGSVSTESAAYEAGLRAGDRVISINGEDIESWNELQSTVENNPNRELLFAIDRDGQNLELTITPKLDSNENPLSLKKRVGSVDGLSMLSEAPVVGVFDPNGPAGKAGFQPGDKISKINGEEIKYWRDLEKFIPAFQSSEAIKIEVLRGEEDKQTEQLVLQPGVGENSALIAERLKLESQSEELSENPVSDSELDIALARLGLEAPHLYLFDVVKGSPADEAGLKTGDRLVAIDGDRLSHWQSVLEKVSGFKKEQGELALTILRKGEFLETSVTPQMTSHMTRKGTEEERFTAGIRPFTEFALPPTYIHRITNPIAATLRGVERTWDITVMIGVSLVRMVTAEISHKNLGGVISIGQVASQTYQIGITHFLQMMAIISVNLFILNLLPIPILDGGHLVFFTIEAVRGAPLSLRKMAIAHQVGLLLLMTLMVFALFNDISRLFNPF